MTRKLRPSPCVDCGANTTPYNAEGRPIAGTWEYFVVVDDVWLAAGMPHDNDRSPGGDFLCVGCLEARIGRALTAHDFTDAPINNPVGCVKSPRLRARLSGATQ